MYNIRLGYGCGIKATLLTASGEVCDLRRARYKGALLVLPNGSTMPCADVSVDDITNAMYVRLLGDRELTNIGKYGIVFNVKLANGVMYSSPVVMFGEVLDNAEMEYKELNISIAVTVTYLPSNVAYTGASPKISPNGTWLVYNDDINAYEDTGEPANYAGITADIQELQASFNTQNITGLVAVDWKTVGKNDSGEICVIGGDTEVADYLAGYLKHNDYVQRSVLNEYATHEWVESKGYITEKDIPLNIGAFVNDKGYITLDAIAPYAKKGTTLGDYGIENAYTKSECEAAFFAATKIDNVTIKRDEDGFLYVASGGGGNAGIDEAQLADYLARNLYTTEGWVYSQLDNYALKSAIPTDYLTQSGEQDVYAVKNFIQGLKIGDLPIYKSQDKTIYIDGNLVVSGCITALGTNETISPSIFEALPIDGATLKRTENGVLYVDTNVVGGGGSGGGSVDPSQLEAYLKPYAKTADVASTYATIASLSAVTSRLNDFLSGSDTDTIINKWSELETFLAGLTETDNLATILSGKANKATTLAGYGITDAYTKLHIDSNFVTIGTKQEITGEKDFVGGFKVNGGLVEYNATLKTWVFNGDLLVTGGMAAFSNIGGFKPSTITDAVLIDNRTIKRNADGLLYAVAQETDGINEDQLEKYLTTNGYATQDWVTGRGYITSSALSGYLPKAGGNLTGNIIMTDGVTIRSSEGNVAGTLKFGADTTNYRTILGTATRETLLIGTTAIKFWRGANSKEYTMLDSYNYADYALPKNGTAAAASKLATSRSLWGRAFDGSADLTGSLTVTTGEGYRINYNGYDLRFIISGSSSNRGIWDNTNNNWLMYRSGSNDIYFTSGNIGFGTTSPTEKVTVGGNINLSGAYNYKIQGKDVVSIYSTNYYLADSAIELGYNTFVVGRKINFQTSTTTTKATTATLDGSGNFSITGVLNLPAVDSGFTNPRITFGDSVIRIGATTAGLLGVYASGDIRMNPNSASSANSTMGLWLKASGFNGINISNPTQALHVNGKGIFADATNPWVALQRNGENWYLQVVSTGLKLGKTSASGILVDASGNLVAPGGVTATNSSDERLKRDLRKFNASKVLMSLGGVWEYEYIDSEVQKNHIYEGTHYGLIYQHVKGTTLDVMCHEREDGMGALNYIHPKFISLIAGATMENISEVEKLKRKIRTLEAKVKQLENRA